MRNSILIGTFPIFPLHTRLTGTLRRRGTRLHTQASREDELTDSSTEAAQERIEGLFFF